MPGRAPETSLYAAVKAHLERLGYEAKGEVCGCDVVAVRPGERPFLVVTEMKLGFTLELVLQGVDRLAAADEVWLAVRATRKGRDRDSRARKLCRLLGFGLLAVDPARNSVEVLAEPAPYRPRVNQKRRTLLLREHGRREGDPTRGGATRTPIMTAYRQRALLCAAAMREEPRRPRDLRPTVPDAGSILLRNVYGWFQRAERGVYRLTPAGREAVLGREAGRPRSNDCSPDPLLPGEAVPAAGTSRQGAPAGTPVIEGAADCEDVRGRFPVRSRPSSACCS